MILFLNDIAGSEIALIFLFILIFFGAKSIPGIARSMGRTIRQVKDATSDIQSEIKKSSSGIKKDLNLDGIIKDTASEVRKPLDQMASDLDQSVKFSAPKHPNRSNLSKKPSRPKIEEENTSDKSSSAK